MADQTMLFDEQFKMEMRRLKQDSTEMSRKIDQLIEKTILHPNAGGYYTSYVGEKPSRRNRSGEGNNKLPDKKFVTRNSVLTDLFKVPHIRTIETIVIAVLTTWAISTAVNDYFERKSLSAMLPSFGLIERSFVGYQYAIIAWLKMMFASFLFYPLALFWGINRDDGPKMTRFDWVFLVAYFLYQFFFLMIPYDILFHDAILGKACAVALAMEQVRLMMKMHAFAREVSRKMLRDPTSDVKKTDGDEEITPVSSSEFPGFGKYLYFMFAPTLVYRDVYPRTPSVNWSYVVSNIAQTIGCVVYVYYVLDRYLAPEFATYQPYTVTFEMIIKSAFRCIIPGSTVYIMTFFGFLHSWLNAWAEMLRFGDRLFYKDWWNVTNYAEFWRTWNCLVHDWLYAYMYKDVQEVLKIRNKLISSSIVFGVSAIVHEYIMLTMLRFFYPILLLLFVGIGFPLMFVRSHGRFYNGALWVTIFFGTGLMINMYFVEISARQVCPPVFDNILFDLAVPRFFACMKP